MQTKVKRALKRALFNNLFVRKIIIIVVIETNKVLVLNPKLEDAKTLGIIIKIINGFKIPPVKYINDAN